MSQEIPTYSDGVDRGLARCRRRSSHSLPRGHNVLAIKMRTTLLPLSGLHVHAPIQYSPLLLLEATKSHLVTAAWSRLYPERIVRPKPAEAHTVSEIYGLLRYAAAH